MSSWPKKWGFAQARPSEPTGGGSAHRSPRATTSVGTKFREPYLAKWRSWDWAKQDVELARETGLSRERIRQIRLLIRAPRSPHHKRFPARLRRTTIALQWAADNLDRLKGLSGAEVRRKHGFSRFGPVYEFLKAQRVLRDGSRKYRWGLMNFDLPSGVLERIWKLPLYRAANYRYRNRLAAPKWPLVSGPGALQRRGELRAYSRAVKAEERKAAKYFAQAEAAGYSEASEGCGGRI